VIPNEKLINLRLNAGLFKEAGRLRADLAAANALLREVIRHSDDVQPGMVLEYLGNDIRKHLGEVE
jgi:hypothetical protein